MSDRQRLVVTKIATCHYTHKNTDRHPLVHTFPCSTFFSCHIFFSLATCKSYPLIFIRLWQFFQQHKFCQLQKKAKTYLQHTSSRLRKFSCTFVRISLHIQASIDEINLITSHHRHQPFTTLAGVNKTLLLFALHQKISTPSHGNLKLPSLYTLSFLLPCCHRRISSTL